MNECKKHGEHLIVKWDSLYRENCPMCAAITLIKQTQTNLSQSRRGVQFQIGKVNFRASQLRNERDENRRLTKLLKTVRGG